MAFTAEVSARNAENDRANAPGMCLQVVRTWCGINATYPDASTAWRNTNDRHPGDRHPPRGAAVYWTGGSSGHGHIALSLGGGKVRSTDAGGRGVVATRELGWFETNWHLPYGGWSWDINEQTIIHTKPDVVDTGWERVRHALLAALNSKDADNVAKKRKKVRAFITETKAKLDELPKQ